MARIAGRHRAELPGNLEWQRERDYARDGVPISPQNQQALQDLADELGVETPFAQYAHNHISTE